MKASMEWIKTYADIPVDGETYAQKMIMIGNGVEGVEQQGAEVSGVVVGRVLTCHPHPDSDHLKVTTVDVGGERPLQIVCGAPNCAAGILVPVATVGAALPGGMTIKKGKLRGMESEGMLCSGEELGVPVELYPSVGAAGLLIFQEDHLLGSDVKPILGIDGTVMDFEVLANRPDCLSVWGIARETAVALDTQCHLPEVSYTPRGSHMDSEVAVSVEDTTLCPRYMARVVRNVRVGPSPMWLRKALHGAGMRSINNVVDITNFVMLETGHPMHAFNLDMVAGRQIIVRRATPGETITTLDGKPHALSPDQLVICDGEKPACLAGIMGGEESEIGQDTRTMMLECAVFDRASVRVTAKALGIRTESSSRFEKGVSPRTVEQAMDRACQLIHQLDAGDVAEGTYDSYPAPLPPQVIHASCDRIARRTGVDIPPDASEAILRKLSFQVDRNGDQLTVTVPAFRQDVEGEADLSEEVLRIYGYDGIPSARLRGETTQGGRSPRMALRDQVGALLTGMGFYEIMNYSFVSRADMEKLSLPADDSRLQMVEIRNPLGADTSVMRTTLLPGMGKTIALNMNHGNPAARLFEVAATFDPGHPSAEGLPRENQTLAFGVYGKEESFYTLRTVAERILHQLGVSYTIVRSQEPYLHPGRQAALRQGDVTLCILGEVHPEARKAFEMPDRGLMGEMNLQAVAALVQPMGAVKPMPRFPAVTRDLALVMGEDTPIGPLLQGMRDAAGPLLEEANLFDVYRSPAIGAGKKSAAFSFVFRSSDHTLVEEEVQAIMDKLLQYAGDTYGAVRR